MSNSARSSGRLKQWFLPISAVVYPASFHIWNACVSCGGIRVSLRRQPVECGYLPVMIDVRAGTHSG